MDYTANQAPPTVIFVTTNNAPQQTYPQQFYPAQTYPPNSHPAQSYPPPPPPVIAPGNRKWRNKPQTDAIAAGGLLFLSAGMNLALGVGWSEHSYYGYSLEGFQYGWFVAVIIGSIFSMPLRHLLTTRLIMAISSALIVIGGITYTCQPRNNDALLAGRYLNGIAIGLMIVPFLMHASEVADDTYRGTCLATEQYSVSLGITIQMIYTSYWDGNTKFSANILHGIFEILIGLMAAVSLKYYIESPITLLRKGNESEALTAQSRLKRPVGVTTETISLLEQSKNYVRQEQSLSIAENIKNGFLPLLKMLLFRSMMLAFCFSLPLNMGFHYSMIEEETVWAPSVAACCRVLGSLMALMLINNMGRKIPSLLAMAVIGGLSLYHAYLFHSVYYAHNFAVAKYYYIAIQFFAGFFAPYASVYIGEAFPLKLKPFLMDVCIITEQLLHIIFIMTIQIYLSDNLSAQGGIIVGAFVVMCLCLPETKNTSLSEAQMRFRKFFYLKFN